MTKKLLVGVVIILMMSFTTAHKFYLSVTSINASEDDDALQITMRVFTDDLDALLETRYGIHGYLDTPEEHTDSEVYIEKYLHGKLLLWINGEQVVFNYLGREYQDDQTVCYLEVAQAGLKSVKSVEIQNDVLTDMFEEQQNIVHFKSKGVKKSFNLIRGNNKGMLKF